MNFDEFKATKDTTGKMAFMIVDNEKGFGYRSFRHFSTIIFLIKGIIKG